MAIESKEIEEKKDEVLQQIYDMLEKYQWGGGCERTTFRIVFSGKLVLEDIHVNQKERTIRCYQ